MVAVTGRRVCRGQIEALTNSKPAASTTRVRSGSRALRDDRHDESVTDSWPRRRSQVLNAEYPSACCMYSVEAGRTENGAPPTKAHDVGRARHGQAEHAFRQDGIGGPDLDDRNAASSAPEITSSVIVCVADQPIWVARVSAYAGTM